MWKRECKAIEAAFPEFTFVQMNGGIQLRHEARIITFWFKKRKFHDNRSNDWDKFYEREPIEELIIDWIKKSIQPTKTQKQVPNLVKDFTGNFGTIACIRHIEKKLEAYKRVNKDKGNTEAVLMMKVLIDELKQYL